MSESPKKSEQHTKVSRREFARHAVFAAATAVVAPPLIAQEPTAPNPTPAPDKPPETSVPLSPQLQQEGELKFQWIVQKYGDRLSAADKADIHRLVMEGQKPLAALRAYPLQNSDMPATVLRFTDAESGSNGDRG